MDDGKANALSKEMIAGLLDALSRAEQEAGAIVLAGRAERFCAGFDLRVIAVATPARWPAIPNAPTLADSGINGIGYLGWYGLVFPAGTPQLIIDKLHKAMQNVLAKDAVKNRLEGIGAVANLSSPAEFRKVIQSDIKGFQEVAKLAGLETK